MCITYFITLFLCGFVTITCTGVPVYFVVECAKCYGCCFFKEKMEMGNMSKRHQIEVWQKQLKAVPTCRSSIYYYKTCKICLYTTFFIGNQKNSTTLQAPNVTFRKVMCTTHTVYHFCWYTILYTIIIVYIGTINERFNDDSR